jgi:enamine deaminase RidA (YjgF/YER057c/UK114 family)
VIKEKLTSMGIDLPHAASPLGSYVPIVILGHAAFVSGQIPLDYTSEPAQLRFKGKVGKEVSIDDARKAASICVVNALGHLELELGSLENIKRIVKVTGYVNCESSFTEHPRVMNGASDLLLDIFGDIGRHTRVAVGTNSLPLDSPVELDMIVEIREVGGDASV